MFKIKRNIALLLFCLFIFLPVNSFAQKPCDYFPLNTGNFWEWDVINIGESNYPVQAMHKSLNFTNTISGNEYLHMTTIYYYPSTTINSQEAQVFELPDNWNCWLRESEDGKIVLGCIGNSNKPGSSGFCDVEYFPDDSKAPGFIPEGYDESTITHSISVEYVSENISVPAGIFNDCLKKKTEIFNNGEIISKKTEYYAKGVGKVLEINEIPEESAHRLELFFYNINNETSVTDRNDNPPGFDLKQNYPNPFNAETTIDLTVPYPGNINICIYNLIGQKIRTLIDSYTETGTHRVVWDGKNDSGKDVSSGVYIVNLKSGSSILSKHITMIR